MPSLMCSALYSRRSIRNLELARWGRLRSDDTARGGEEDDLTGSLLPGALLSYALKHPGGPTCPTGSLDTEYQVLISYPVPKHEWQEHGYFSFRDEEQFSAEITAFPTKNIKQSHLLFLRHCLFFFLKDYLLRHKETTRLCL